ncbi:antimicrobial peptide system protein%2C SdpB family [Mycobacteroides abscessus]|nr:antimicrobial peptide system protein%2C SdpB family [Mycobacteroides abscessus]
MKSLRLSQQSILALVRFDHRNLWFAVGRVSLALATLSEVIFTSPRALFVPVGGVEGPYCRLGEYLSIYCLGSPDSHLEFKRIAVAAILGVVVSGYRPRYLALPHLWATYSVSTSITLPDGGDSIALICLILLTPLCLIDPRRWIWNAPGHRMSLDCRAIGLASQWALRIQFAFIYADSALTKVGVADWANGSAFYYWLFMIEGVERSAAVGL